MVLTPEELESLKKIRLRIAEIDAHLAKLRPNLDSTTIPQYIELNRERDKLDGELGGDA